MCTTDNEVYRLRNLCYKVIYIFFSIKILISNSIVNLTEKIQKKGFC